MSELENRFTARLTCSSFPDQKSTDFKSEYFPTTLSNFRSCYTDTTITAPRLIILSALTHVSYLQSGVGMSASDVTISDDDDDDDAALVSLQKQDFKASNSQTFSHHTLFSQSIVLIFTLHIPHSSSSSISSVNQQ